MGDTNTTNVIGDSNKHICSVCTERIIRCFDTMTCEVCITPEEQEILQSIDPKQPTTAQPGSRQKVLTMRAREEIGIPIFNPKDYVPKRFIA